MDPNAKVGRKDQRRPRAAERGIAAQPINRKENANGLSNWRGNRRQRIRLCLLADLYGVVLDVGFWRFQMSTIYKLRDGYGVCVGDVLTAG